MTIDPKDYRDYLDKEMTIMGILSAVAIAVPAGRRAQRFSGCGF